MKRGPEKEIKAQITITALYDDCIRITVHDVNSGLEFIRMELTREQFINAAMNRLSNCDIGKTIVRSLDIVGKMRESKSFEFKLPEGTDYHNQKQQAINTVMNTCPESWEPDTSFSSQGSFFTKGEEKWAKTTIRRWV